MSAFLLDNKPFFWFNTPMTSDEIRTRFLEFFSARGAKGRGHAVVPSSSLIPDDPSVLLTTAGMQQFKPYYTGSADALKDFGSLNTVSVQKSFRTSDIEEVGDERHLTFFEMLGNFSFGGYFKREAITYAYEFLTKEMGLEISYVTIFQGKDSIGVPKDEESRRIWQSLGVADIREEGMDDVFWGPTGSGGPCGPTTEIYCKNGAGQDIEVWNIVFNEFFFAGSREELNSGSSGKKLEPLSTPGVDTGMGLERLAMVVQKTPTIFETDLFAKTMDLLSNNFNMPIKRIISDHLRGTLFLISDGVLPSNKGAGYIVRRLIRRTIAHFILIRESGWKELLMSLCEQYRPIYPEINTENIIHVFVEEHMRFSRALRNGINELKKMPTVTTKDAFRLYESFGLSYEIIKDIGKERVKGITREEFDKEFKKHQEISRAGQEGKFGGHGLLLDTGELKAGTEEEVKIVTRLHTATHLLQAALRKVLGEEVHQMGSDITPERTRFDFSFGRKVTKEELVEVEDIVNKAIERDYAVEAKQMPYEEATKTGALYFFKEKYPAEVNVYSVYDKQSGEVFSREFCGGPHVSHTGEIGRFKILKEESSSAGVRRIRAHVL